MTEPQPHHPSPGPLPPERPAAAAPPSAGSGPNGDGGHGGDHGGGRRSVRSPLIAPGLVPAAVTTVLAALLAGTAYLPLPAFVCAVVLLQAVTAAGWFRLNGMWPARQGIALAFLAGLTADVAMLVVDPGQVMNALVGTFGVWFLLNLVLHLRNRSTPDERLYALTVALTATALTVVAGGYVAALAAAGARSAETLTAGADTVTLAAAGVAAAVLFRALPLPRYVSPAVAALAAAGAGYGAAPPGFAVTGPEAAVLGLAAGLCALTGLRAASYDFPSRFVHMTAGVALPLTLAAPAAYALGGALA